MEIESTNHQDVAEPDGIASGTAGTGQENGNTTGISPDLSGNNSPHTRGRHREVIGLGVLYNGAMNPGRLSDTSHCTGKESAEDPQGGCGDCLFEVYERQERIADRLNKKIARLDRRLTTMEERGRLE